MASGPRVPISTYRLQFNRHFGFKDAIEIVPYLEKLGISDIYSSPFFRSRPDSDHGYDVSNHNELNPSIGTRADFEGFFKFHWGIGGPGLPDQAAQSLLHALQ